MREHTTALVAFIATLVLTLISEFALNLSPEGTYITFATGALISLSVAVLKTEILRDVKGEFKNVLSLYDTLSKVEGEGVREWVFELAKEFSRGELPPYVAAIYSRRLITEVKETLHASDYSPDSRAILDWSNKPRHKTWFLGNVEAIHRGVNVERVFVLRKHEVMSGDQWDGQVRDILQQHHDAGVDVRVLWIEDLIGGFAQRNLEQNFVIYDGREVLVQDGRTTTRIYRPPSEKVGEYKIIYEEQKKYSHRWEEMSSGILAGDEVTAKEG
jgi:hypothetical protein